MDKRDFIELTYKKLEKISESESLIPYGEGKWTKKEVVGHLIDSAVNNHNRFILSQLQNDLNFSGYDHENWVRLQNHNSLDWSFLIGLWKSYNLLIAHVISEIHPDVLLTKRAEHSLDKIAWKKITPETPATLNYLISDYYAHMEHHLNQILDNKIRGEN